jgi:hypothetical protein
VPESAKVLNCATPCTVVAVVDPLIVPPPLATATVTVVFAFETRFPSASRTSTTGCVENGTPDDAPSGCVRTTNREALPAVTVTLTAEEVMPALDAVIVVDPTNRAVMIPPLTLATALFDEAQVTLLNARERLSLVYPVAVTVAALPDARLIDPAGAISMRLTELSGGGGLEGPSLPPPPPHATSSAERSAGSARDTHGRLEVIARHTFSGSRTLVGRACTGCMDVSPRHVSLEA